MSNVIQLPTGEQTMNTKLLKGAAGKWLARMRDTNNAWTENDIIYFRKAIGFCGIKDAEVRKFLKKSFDKFAEQNDGYLITHKHSEKGREYLLAKSLKKNGEYRKGSKLGARELHVMQNLSYHKFVGLYEQYNMLGEVLGYLPIYKAVANDGSSFEYVGATYEMVEIVA